MGLVSNLDRFLEMRETRQDHRQRTHYQDWHNHAFHRRPVPEELPFPSPEPELQPSPIPEIRIQPANWKTAQVLNSTTLPQACAED